MALSAFDDKAHPPSAIDLEAVLGRASARWDELKTHLSSAYDPLGEHWNFAGEKWGWSLRLKQKKRTLIYLTPRKKHFLAGFVLGEKAVRAARASDLPAAVLEVIDRAPKYAEGRGFRLEVRTKSDVESVKKLAAVKMGD